MSFQLAKKVVDALIRQSGGALNVGEFPTRCTNCGNKGHGIVACPHRSPHRFAAKDALGDVRVM